MSRNCSKFACFSEVLIFLRMDLSLYNALYIIHTYNAKYFRKAIVMYLYIIMYFVPLQALYLKNTL